MASDLQPLFAEFLRSGAADFEDFVARHPAAAAALRELHGQYQQYLEQRQLFERLAGDPVQGRLAEELRQQFGEGVDPGISLDGGKPSEESAPSGELLQRLRAQAPRNARYQPLGEIGRGGMGAVLRVWDKDLRRTLAMKVVLGKSESKLPDAPASLDPRRLGRFLEEAQITGQLDHPGIVPVHELGLGADGQVFFTMRLVKGEDLRTIFRHVESGHEGWNTTRALGVMLKVCEAMAYAHAKGVIHRDLKPANIMVGRYGEVYVMDWGLARVEGAQDLHDLRLTREAGPASASVRTERRTEREELPDSPIVTLDGDVMGTPAYMPPEQARGELARLGPHSDVYAVGAMLYHLLLVRQIEMPYVPKGMRLSQLRVLMLVGEGPPTPIQHSERNAPAALVAIVEKAMARDIEQRYRNMEELAGDLRAYVEGRVVKAHETGTWAETKQWVRRNRALTLAVCAAMLALIGGISFTLLEQRKTERANLELRAQAREQELRGMIQEVGRFRAQCRSTDGLQRLDRPAWQWWLLESAKLLQGEAGDEPGAPGHATDRKWRPGLADVRSKLEELRAQALPWTDEDRERDRATHPLQARIRDLEEERDEQLEDLRSEADSSSSPTELAAKAARQQQTYAERLEPLREQTLERRSWRFLDSQKEWWHAQVQLLEAELSALSELRAAALASVETENARARWAEAIESIARSPRYAGQRWPGGARLTPQLGLLPLGENPNSGLWEFVHLQSGAEPRPTPLSAPSAETGIVFVLLPGGLVPRQANPQGQAEWIPALELRPFFISKYELTHEQWDRLSVRKGVAYLKEVPTVPANNISWDDVRAMWPRELGWCDFPSEAQWEYACRAGSATRWWSGDLEADLAGVAQLDNLRAVGSLRPNAFGLHDVHGNVYEWCGDSYDAQAAPRAGDGLRDDGVDLTSARVLRGGSWYHAAEYGRSGCRSNGTSGDRFGSSGLRPARAITP